MLSRFEIRPVVSRRLRAALLLVLILSVLSLSQTSLSGGLLVLTGLALMAVFMMAWRAPSRTPPWMAFTFRPTKAFLIDSNGLESPMHCVRLSLYPWLIVMHAENAQYGQQVIVLLPDSLSDRSPDQWRQLLIWAKRMRRQIAMQ